jgi:response regulator RpfG family c-di-GMP phosphodiesterase
MPTENESQMKFLVVDDESDVELLSQQQLKKKIRRAKLVNVLIGDQA